MVPLQAVKKSLPAALLESRKRTDLERRFLRRYAAVLQRVRQALSDDYRPTAPALLDALMVERMLESTGFPPWVCEAVQAVLLAEAAPLPPHPSLSLTEVRDLAAPLFQECRFVLRPEDGESDNFPQILGPEVLALAHERCVLEQDQEQGQSRRKRSGAFYTPLPLARELCRRTLAAWGGSASGTPLVCDPAAGGGVFLVAMLHLLLEGAPSPGKRCLQVLRGLHGVDLDPRAVRLCRARLLCNALALGLPLADLPEAVRVLQRAITPGDSLLEERGQHPDFSWSGAFPEILGHGPGFDLLVGNPPFLRIQRLPPETRDFCRRLFSVARGKFDAASCFVEQGLRLLAPGGALGFVLPGRLLTTAHGQTLLDMLEQRATIFLRRDISPEAGGASCGSAFDAASYACLLGVRSGVRPAEQGRALPSAPVLRTSAKGRETTPLQRVCEAIFQGGISGGDRYFLLHDLEQRRHGLRLVRSTHLGREFWLEEAVLRPLLKGGDVARYALLRPRFLALYPYAPDSGGGGLLREAWLRASTPKAWEYLLELRPELSRRGTARMRYASWYAWWCPRSPGAFVRPKVLVRALALRPACTYDEGGHLFSGGGNAGVYGLLPRPGFMGAERGACLFLLALCNSRRMEAHVAAHSPVFRGGYRSHGRRYIADLPVALPGTGEGRELARLAALALEAGEEHRPPLEEELDERIGKLYM